MNDTITVADVLRARQRIAPYLVPTPAHRYPALEKQIGFNLWIKHENHQPTGAFKVRGGVNYCGTLSPAERQNGVIAASTGNHGQSVAFAARLYGIPAKIVVPEGANPDKVRAIQNFGADIIHFGKNYEECKRHAEELAASTGIRYVSAGDEPLLIAGVATYALELLETAPELDAIYVPVGGGSGASGCCIVGHAVRPGLKVIGVQSAHAPAVYESWKTGSHVTTDTADTFAEGLATLSPFELPLGILRRELDDFVLVTDDELRDAIRMLLTYTHNIAEGAGAAAFAAAWREREKWQGKNVGVIMSGGNLTMEQLRDILKGAK